MTNYVKTTNFLLKDSLPDTDAAKIIRGSEFDIEFNNLVISIASKANLNSPEFIGVPKAPTASVGSKTTQIANTSFVTTAVGNVKDILGSMADQDADAVDITGGSITGLSNLETADGTISGGSIQADIIKVGDAPEGGQGWHIHAWNDYLYFRYNTNNVLRLDKKGHLVAEDNITAFGGV